VGLNVGDGVNFINLDGEAENRQTTYIAPEEAFYGKSITVSYPNTYCLSKAATMPLLVVALPVSMTGCITPQFLEPPVTTAAEPVKPITERVLL
jgi:hypothetical protein